MLSLLMTIRSWKSKAEKPCIFSLKNNSWKTIEIDFPMAMKYWNDIGSEGIALNGAIRRSCKEVIHVFDLVEEKFKTLPLPDSILKHPDWISGGNLLSNLGDQYLNFVELCKCRLDSGA
ncbi:hypothetical protein EZV62_021465 [Acer yangbiense]|uniref:Uncharacterized protein n=1 Tax=Acer yangbiense TaxID=1000413 RepID=A0A5C7H7Y1_9ROSI|nr:hypothetical protein EZV62_021465 [Acer yangbiense]